MAAIKIDGVEYELPETGLKLGEMRIVERYRGGIVGDYGIASTAGLIHVAILRKRPGTPFEEIQAVVDEIDFDLITKLVEDSVGDADPPPEGTSDATKPSSEDSSSGLEPSRENGSPTTTGAPTSRTGSESSLETSRT